MVLITYFHKNNSFSGYHYSVEESAVAFIEKTMKYREMGDYYYVVNVLPLTDDEADRLRWIE